MEILKIVIVEDHVLTRAGLKAALEDHADLKVVGEASNGVDGLKILSTTPCDVAILDVGLPDFDGIELLRRLGERLDEASKPNI
ncbi:MAG: response regulator transcription factor [Acaryochloridaceae cyanobacterium RL_2_7]|nr:response regulator transcription factor [Acaryochloridaceae cyanobacterium RL_2_7]